MLRWEQARLSGSGGAKQGGAGGPDRSEGPAGVINGGGGGRKGVAPGSLLPLMMQVGFGGFCAGPFSS